MPMAAARGEAGSTEPDSCPCLGAAWPHAYLTSGTAPLPPGKQRSPTNPGKTASAQAALRAPLRVGWPAPWALPRGAALARGPEETLWLKRKMELKRKGCALAACSERHGQGCAVREDLPPLDTQTSLGHSPGTATHTDESALGPGNTMHTAEAKQAAPGRWGRVRRQRRILPTFRDGSWLFLGFFLGAKIWSYSSAYSSSRLLGFLRRFRSEMTASNRERGQLLGLG